MGIEMSKNTETSLNAKRQRLVISSTVSLVSWLRKRWLRRAKWRRLYQERSGVALISCGTAPTLPPRS
jgi:hypothetical protein